MSQIKRCPYCYEEIHFFAIKCKHCGSMLTDAPYSGSLSGIDLVRQALGNRYEILEEIGRGGMSTVYKAIQRNLNRTIALKVVHQNLLHDEEFVARFHREAQLCASLSHPNIVTVYDEGEVSGVHFMAMEYLEGTDLHELIRAKRKLATNQTLQYLLPVAEALDYAHQKGLIHRDIKSSNIFISGSGRVVLMDFGIAHAAGSKVTVEGTVIGTPEYMSPEQAEGRKVDHRTDLYGFGVVMYECISGKVPFSGENAMSTIHKVIYEQPQTDRFGRVPASLEQLTLNLLSKNPDERLNSASDVVHALKQIQGGQSWQPAANKRTIFKGKRTSRHEKARDKSRKNPAIVWFLVVLGVSLTALLVLQLKNLQKDSGGISSFQPGDAGFMHDDLTGIQDHEEISITQIPPEGFPVDTGQAVTDPQLTGLSGESSVSPETTTNSEQVLDRQAWQRAQSRNTTAAYEQYLRDLPAGQHAAQARTRIREIEQEILRQQDQQAWQRAQNLNTISSYNYYLQEHPNGRHVTQARTNKNNLERIAGEEAARRADPFYEQMVLVRGGTFMMGCNQARDNECFDDEKPSHRVTLRDFYISKYHVTQGQWRQIMGNNPSHFSSCEDCPVENVSWNDVQEFIRRLNQRTGKNYRLPTEAEWEYAARGGNQSRGYVYAGSNNPNNVVWHRENSGSRTRPIGSKSANELGLFDMGGNVHQWCQDRYGAFSNTSLENPTGPSTGSRRVIRGGSWNDAADRCRLSARANASPDTRNLYIGFRLSMNQ